MEGGTYGNGGVRTVLFLTSKSFTGMSDCPRMRYKIPATRATTMVTTIMYFEAAHSAFLQSFRPLPGDNMRDERVLQRKVGRSE